jgi:hypothetical protein
MDKFKENPIPANVQLSFCYLLSSKKYNFQKKPKILSIKKEGVNPL